MPERPNKVRPLHVIARDYADFGVDTDLSTTVVDDALRSAGLDWTDKAERCRFRQLVRAENERQLGDELAKLGRFADKARRHLGDTASMMDVIALGQQLQEQSDEARDSDFG